MLEVLVQFGPCIRLNFLSLFRSFFGRWSFPISAGWRWPPISVSLPVPISIWRRGSVWNVGWWMCMGWGWISIGCWGIAWWWMWIAWVCRRWIVSIMCIRIWWSGRIISRIAWIGWRWICCRRIFWLCWWNPMGWRCLCSCGWISWWSCMCLGRRVAGWRCLLGLMRIRWSCCRRVTWLCWRWVMGVVLTVVVIMRLCIWILCWCSWCWGSGRRLCCWSCLWGSLGCRLGRLGLRWISSSIRCIGISWSLRSSWIGWWRIPIRRTSWIVSRWVGWSSWWVAWIAGWRVWHHSFLPLRFLQHVRVGWTKEIRPSPKAGLHCCNRSQGGFFPAACFNDRSPINTFILLEHKPAAMFAMFGWVVVLGKKRKQMYVCVCVCVCVSQFRNVFVWKIKTCLKMWQHGHVNVTALTCLNLLSTLGSSFAILHAQQNMSKKTSWIFFPPCPPPTELTCWTCKSLSNS